MDVSETRHSFPPVPTNRHKALHNYYYATLWMYGLALHTILYLRLLCNYTLQTSTLHCTAPTCSSHPLHSSMSYTLSSHFSSARRNKSPYVIPTHAYIPFSFHRGRMFTTNRGTSARVSHFTIPVKSRHMNPYLPPPPAWDLLPPFLPHTM